MYIKNILIISAVKKQMTRNKKKRERTVFVNSFRAVPSFSPLKILPAIKMNSSNWTKSRKKRLI
jgi:hypothetical protein